MIRVRKFHPNPMTCVRASRNNNTHLYVYVCSILCDGIHRYEYLMIIYINYSGECTATVTCLSHKYRSNEYDYTRWKKSSTAYYNVTMIGWLKRLLFIFSSKEKQFLPTKNTFKQFYLYNWKKKMFHLCDRQLKKSVSINQFIIEVQAPCILVFFRCSC